MPQFQSTSKNIRSLITLAKHVRQTFRTVNPLFHLHKSSQPRCLSLIACFRYPKSVNHHFEKDSSYLVGGICSQFQKRSFLGCGDDEEGGVLSKVYEERIVLGYSPEQLFDVVAAVDLYHGIVPWCRRSDIIRHHPDGSFDAELEIGFKFLVESYISHVELKRPNLVNKMSMKSGSPSHPRSSKAFSSTGVHHS